MIVFYGIIGVIFVILLVLFLNKHMDFLDILHKKDMDTYRSMHHKDIEKNRRQ